MGSRVHPANASPETSIAIEIRRSHPLIKPFPYSYPASSLAHSIAKGARSPQPGWRAGVFALDTRSAALVPPAFVAPLPGFGSAGLPPQAVAVLPCLLLQARHGFIAQVIAAPRGVGPGIARGHLGPVDGAAVGQIQPTT